MAENESEEKPEDDIFRLAGELDETVVDRTPVPDGDGSVSGEVAGTQLGPFLLVEKVGEGGFGTVFRAEQKEPVRREVALKIVKAGMDTKEVIARFEAERQALAMMDHQGIARVFDAGSAPSGRPYFVMEYVHGVAVTEYVNTRRLKTRRRLELFMEICEAVQHAHQKGIIHRDLKPSNILVSEKRGEPVVKVIDFGVAKAMGQELTESTLYTAYGQILGTPQYMSPEQAKIGAVDVDTRSDIYALGVILYELLTGRTPIDPATFKLAGLEEVLRTIRDEEPPKPSTLLGSLEYKELDKLAITHREDPDRMTRDLKGDLDWIVMKAIDKERDRRYVSAAAFADDVYAYLTNEPVSAAAPGVGYRLGKYARRNRAAIAVVMVIFLLMAGGMGAVWYQWEEAKRAEEEKEFALEASKANEQEAKKQEKIAMAKTKEAEAKTKEADKSAKAAKESAAEARKLSGMFGTAKAEDHFERGEFGLGLAYLARILREDPQNVDAAERLTSVLMQRYAVAPKSVGELIRHDGPIQNAEFSPDGSQVLTASYDKEVRFWGLSGRPLKTKQYGRDVDALKFSAPLLFARYHPGGRRVLTATAEEKNPKLQIWNIDTGESLDLEGLQNTITSAEFSRDGTRVLATCMDGTACLWDMAPRKVANGASEGNNKKRKAAPAPEAALAAGSRTLKPRRTLQLKNGGAWAAEFNHAILTQEEDPREILAVVVGGGGSILRWNLTTGTTQEVGVVAGNRHKQLVFSAKFSHDGNYLVTASKDATAQVWDVRTGELLKVFPHAAEVLSAQFSPDGSRVVTASLDGTAHLWKMQGGNLKGEPLGKPMRHEGGVRSVQFSPDGSRVVTASADKTARIWDARTGWPLGDPMRHDTYVTSARFSPDGKRVVTASADGTAQIWDVGLGYASPEPMRHENIVHCVSFNHDGSLVLTASEDNTARLWSATKRKPWLSNPLKHDHGVRWAAFNEDCSLVVTTSVDHTAQVWDAKTGERKGPALKHEDVVTFAQFSRDGSKVITASADKTARVWNTETGAAHCEPIYHDALVLSAQFTKDGTRVATICMDGRVQLWFTDSGTPSVDDETKMEHEKRVLCLAFSPEGEFLITGSEDGTARVWNVSTGKQAGKAMHHDDKVSAAVFSPDGTIIMTASADKSARLWTWDPRVKDRWELTEPMWHLEAVTGAAFSPDGKRVLTVEGEAGVRVWDAKTGLPLTEKMNARPSVGFWKRSDGWIHSAEFSPDGSRVVAGGADHAARIWDVPLGVAPVPDWVPDWAEEVGGWKLLEDGSRERVLDIPLLERTEAKLAQKPENGYYEKMARWFYAPRDSRTISPTSDLSVPDYIARLVGRDDLRSLREAHLLDPNHPDVNTGLAKLLRELHELHGPKVSAKSLSKEEQARLRQLKVMGGIGEEAYPRDQYEAEAEFHKDPELRLNYWRATN